MESSSTNSNAGSSCQIKGCKSNKRSSKHHDSYVAKENNNHNSCSDEENNDYALEHLNNNNKQHNSKKSQAKSSTVPLNNSNSSNVKNNSSSSSNGNKVKTSTNKSPSKPTTPDLTYSKVVSNSILNYDCPTINIPPISIPNIPVPIVSPIVSTTTTTTTTTTTSEDTSTTDKSTSNVILTSSNEDDTDKKITTTNKTAPKDTEAQQRRAVLSYEQVCRLNDVMNEVVSIHGRGNFPTLEVRLRDLVTVVRGKLEADPSLGGAGMRVRDIRLNGGAASHVLATDAQPYNDLDLIFAVELASGRNYDKVKAAVLGSLFDLLPEGVSRKRITTCSLKEAYVSKMVKVSNDGDRWSLISLGNSRGHRNVELKFVDSMRRQFEFSVDSFQIVLDSLLQYHQEHRDIVEKETTTTTTTTEGEEQQPTSPQFEESDYPEVVGESVYGDFHEALYHLQKKLISTRHPEEIRGGGLLKYCNLLVKMYKPAQPDYIKTLERYMCSRFFIDFPDIGQQKAKLENYLWNHFVGAEEEALKYQYLMLLHSVVEESTVCLMGHERRQTLALIESLAYQVLCQEQQRLSNQHQAPAPAYLYANGYYYAPVIPTACYTCTCNSWMACSS